MLLCYGNRVGIPYRSVAQCSEMFHVPGSIDSPDEGVTPKMSDSLYSMLIKHSGILLKVSVTKMRVLFVRLFTATYRCVRRAAISVS